MKKTAILTTATILFGCAGQHTPKRNPSSHVADSAYNQGIDRYLNEEYEDRELDHIQGTIDAAMVALSRDFRAPRVPRDAHAKSHGCLTASFTVDNSQLPQALRVGLFAKNKSYPTWIRFSNNTSDPMSHDKDLDLRGIAVKVMNVPGKKILPKQVNEETQDFLMFASPIFFVKDVKDYAEFIEALGNGKAFTDLLKRPRTLVQLATAQLKAKNKKNPVKLTYFSASPYRLGSPTSPDRQPVKYSIASCSEKAAKAAVNGNSKDPNFMRKTLKETLAKGDWCFHFKVQVGDRKQPKVYPVEDTSVLWSPKNPYRTVATLRIPKQNFDTRERDQFCEHLSFTPWHALPEHRPIGRTNRMRLKLYEAISGFRHEQNGVPSREPKTLDPKTAFE